MTVALRIPLLTLPALPPALLAALLAHGEARRCVEDGAYVVIECEEGAYDREIAPLMRADVPV